MKKLDKNSEIGLALGGGAALGAAHIGVLKALEENDISVNYIAGTSIGAFVAMLYAFGHRSEQLREIALDLDWLNISSLSLSQYALLSNEKLADLINKYTDSGDFSDAKIPVAVVACDIAKGEKIVLREGNVARAVMASSCIPGVFRPVTTDDQFLVDGGVVENVPLATLKSLGGDYIIAVDLNAYHAFKKPKNIIDVLVNTVHMNLMHATELQTEQADLLIAPDLSEFSLVDTSQVEALIDAGYEEAKKAIKKALE